MAQPAWKRPGSPIGKRNRAKPIRSTSAARVSGGLKEVKQLRSLAKANTPTGVISLKMQRSSASIVSKAQREGILLKPIDRSPYNLRKKAARS
jgi:hypothetical protein